MKQKNISTHSSPSALWMVWVVNATPRPLYPRERIPALTGVEDGWMGSLKCGRFKSWNMRPFSGKNKIFIAEIWIKCNSGRFFVFLHYLYNREN